MRTACAPGRSLSPLRPAARGLSHVAHHRTRLRRDRLHRVLRHLSLRHRLCRKPDGAEEHRRGTGGAAHHGPDYRCHPARHLRRAAQLDGAAVLQADVDKDRSGLGRALDLCAVFESRADPALLAMASDHRAGVDRDESRGCNGLAGRVLDRLGDGAALHLHDQPFRTVRADASLAEHERPEAAAGIQDAVPLWLRAASDLSRVCARLLGNAGHDDGAPAVCGDDDGLHPGGDPAGGVRPDRRFRRSVRGLSPPRLDAHPVAAETVCGIASSFSGAARTPGPLRIPVARRRASMTITGFFEGTGMPDPGWWEALWPDPRGVLAAVGLQPDMEVIDLCSGDGWFTLPIAKLAARVWAIDIDPVLLATAKVRLEEAGVRNCVFVEGDAYDVARLVPQQVDFVFLANVFHGVPDKPKLSRAVAASLKVGGLFAVVNWYARSREETTVLGEPRGPATALRIGPEATIAAVEASCMLKSAKVVQVSPYH